jgi:hypothetical protein
MYSTNIHQMTGFPTLPSSVGIGKPGPSSWGLPGSKVGDDSAFRTRNVDFAFIQTRDDVAF